MPVKIKKINGYRVSTPSGIKAKRTTKTKAQRQARLLRAVEHTSWRPTGKKAQSSRKKVSHNIRSRNPVNYFSA